MLDLELAVPIAVACVLVAALCASTEVALFSLRRTERDQLSRSSRAVDKLIVGMLEKPRKLIATVVIGTEACVAGLVAVALAALLRWYSPWQAAGLALAIALPVAVLVMEVTAKTVAARSPLGWARMFAPLLRGFALVVAPVRWLVGGVATVLLRPLGDVVRSRPVKDLSEAEFRKLVDAGSAHGQVDARERRLIHRVFEFSDKNVGQVMTPRDRIYALSYDLPMQRIAREVAARGFSRVPIYQKSLDNIRGVINAKDLVRATGGLAQNRPLAELLHEPLFVPRTTPVKRLFLTFKTRKVHMAVVVSEYGKVLGLVTMDDLLAQIFGVLRDERAALQDDRTSRPRTPPTGVAQRPSSEASGPVSSPPVTGESTAPVPRLADATGDATGPTTMPMLADEASGPVRADSDTAALDPPPRPVRHATADPVAPIESLGSAEARNAAEWQRGGSIDAVPVGLRSAEHAIPIYPAEELTPPATDAAELAASADVEISPSTSAELRRRKP
jgi:putative hemolysin